MDRNERTDARVDFNDYEFLQFAIADSEKKLKTLLINKSNNGYCCLYIGEEEINEDDILVDSNNQHYEIAWIDSKLGSSKSLGLHLKKDVHQHSIVTEFEHYDPMEEGFEDQVLETLKGFENKLEKKFKLTVYTITDDFERLRAIRFSGNNVLLFRGSMKKVLPWLNGMTSKFAIINIDAANWQEYLSNVIRFFTHQDPVDFDQCQYHRNSNVRSQVIQEICEQYPDLGNRDRVKLETILEEMLMNGFYDAPTDERGINIYASYDRKIDVALSEEEALALCHTQKEKMLWLKIRDVFGSFPPAIFLRYLKKCIHGGENAVDDKPGGAGLGLYMMWRNSHSLMLRVNRGKRTEFFSSVDVSLKKSKLSSTICLAQSVD